MKKMFRRSNIFSFIFGLIVMACIGVVYAINADDISYTPRSTTWEVDNVKDAIDELYNMSTIQIEDITSENATFKESYGNMVANRSSSVNVERGAYIVALNLNYSYSVSSASNTNSSNNTANITCSSNNCNLTLLGSKIRTVTASGKNSWSVYNLLNSRLFMYYVVVNEDTDTINYSISNTANNAIPEIQYMYAVKIGE